VLRKKCEEQDKELANFRYKLNESQLNSNSHLTSITAQLVDREDQLNKVQEEVGYSNSIFASKREFYIKSIQV
jgi:hypothetical protein